MVHFKNVNGLNRSTVWSYLEKYLNASMYLVFKYIWSIYLNAKKKYI